MEICRNAAGIRRSVVALTDRQDLQGHPAVRNSRPGHECTLELAPALLGQRSQAGGEARQISQRHFRAPRAVILRLRMSRPRARAAAKGASSALQFLDRGGTVHENPSQIAIYPIYLGAHRERGLPEHRTSSVANRFPPPLRRSAAHPAQTSRPSRKWRATKRLDTKHHERLTR